MVVKFSESAFANLKRTASRPAEQTSILHSALAVPESEMALSIERQFDKRRVAIIRAHPKAGEKPSPSRLQNFNTSASVEYAYPLFVTKTGIDELVLTDEILARFSPEYGQQAVNEFCAQNGLSLIRKTRGRLNVYLLRVNEPKVRFSLQVANSLNGKGGIVWAEPNFLWRLKRHTDDPLYPNLWHLHNTGQGGGVADADVDAPEAWALQTGNPDIVIAIIDDGVDLVHEDLAIWRNPGEWGDGKEDNGVDDDNNGYVDDYQGWDFSGNDNDPNPSDLIDNHGTACAGVAAARGNNNIGVTGIAYGCPVLPVKIVSGNSWVSDAMLGEAIAYAADLADVISCSWGGGAYSGYIEDAIDYAVTNGRGGLGSPVFFSVGNAAARGWTEMMLMGFPPGQQAHAWVYEKDGSNTGGADAAWLDDVTMQNGFMYVEDFNGVTPPSLPAGFSNFTNNSANWITVSDASHARGGSGNSARSGTIGDDQISGIYAVEDLPTGGDLSYYVWVDAGLGDGLSAAYWNGMQWVAYTFFMGAGIDFPANSGASIAVGASNNLDIQSYYSQYGDEIDFVAPSDGGPLSITTTDRTGSAGYSSDNYFSDFGGTSSATP
jgi:subtilisin family serine protease